MCNKKIIKKIADNYINMEKSIVCQLKFDCEHGVTLGGFREEIWKSLFEQIVPKKFSIARSVFLIDSDGKVSKEVDLAIFDEQYTPYIFNYGKLRYIPIEAVAVVVQCKSKKPNHKSLEEWVKSINCLKTSPKSVVRMYHEVAVGEYKKQSTQSSTRPIKILCHTDDRPKEPEQFRELFDIIIHPCKARLNVDFAGGDNSLYYWYRTLNHANPEEGSLVQRTDEKKEKWAGELNKKKLDEYRVYSEKNDKKHEVSLLSLTFQLNQMLMLINNPLFFPHQSYVKMFKDNI